MKIGKKRRLQWKGVALKKSEDWEEDFKNAMKIEKKTCGYLKKKTCVLSKNAMKIEKKTCGYSKKGNEDCEEDLCALLRKGREDWENHACLGNFIMVVEESTSNQQTTACRQGRRRRIAWCWRHACINKQNFNGFGMLQKMPKRYSNLKWVGLTWPI